MHWFTSLLLGNAVIALAIALAALLAMLLRRPALSHVLWLLVLVKLITPPLIRVPVELPWAAATPVVVEAMSVAPSSVVAEDVGDEAIPVATASVSALSASPAVESKPSAAAVATQWFAANAAMLLLAVWMAGTVFYLVRIGIQTRRFHRLLKASETPDASLLAAVEDVSQRMGMASSPTLRLIPEAASPMVMASRDRSILVLPSALVEHLEHEALCAVLAHELAHLSRKDHWVRWLEVIATALMWWHPLLWLARRGLHEAEEQCCDAWVVWALPDSRRAYAEALVTTASLLSAHPVAVLPPGASGLGQFQQLKRRLTMIMQRQTYHVISPMGRWIVAGVLLALPVLPAIAEKTAEHRAEPVTLQSNESTASPVALAAPDAKPADEPKTEAPAEEQAGAQASREQIEAEKAKARARMRQDGRKYSSQQLREAEELYQSANKDLGNPKAKEILEEMVKKFPKVNRTGCAILYLGQRSQGAEREKYLKQAVDDFSDCFYGNGVQVGAYARYLLGHYYRENGEVEKGTTLLKEVIQKYPNSVTHQGDQLAKIAKEDLDAPPKSDKK